MKLILTKSTNVVYAISCTKCYLIYIGETKRKIADRFREQLLSINKQIESNEETPGLPVANHFGDGLSLSRQWQNQERCRSAYHLSFGHFATSRDEHQFHGL